MNDRNPNINEDNLPTRWTSENQPKNKGGRKKDKYKAMQKEWQLSQADFDAIIGLLLLCNSSELKKIASDPDEEIVRSAFANEIIKDFKGGKTNGIRHIAERLFGKAAENIKHTGADGGPIKVIYLDKQDANLV